jgi:hypothetical protein
MDDAGATDSQGTTAVISDISPADSGSGGSSLSIFSAIALMLLTSIARRKKFLYLTLT